MIVDRYPEIEDRIKHQYDAIPNTKDKSYPFFQLVKSMTETLWDFDFILESYKKKIVYFFSIVEEEKRRMAVEDIFQHRGVVKKKMNEIKLTLHNIEREYVYEKRTPTKKTPKKKKKNFSKKEVEKRKINELYSIQYRFIVNSFLKKCEYFFKIEKDFRKRKQDEMIRRMKILGDEDIDEEELKTLIYKGADYNKVQQIYKKRTFKVTRNVQNSIKIEMEGLKQTNEELLQLEKQMNEIMDMFQDMFILTNLMDDPINNIEFMVEQANEYIELGRKRTKNSKKKQVYSPKCTLM